MELKNPYIFLGKIKQMNSFDEMILFITEERNRYIRKMKRVRLLTYSTSAIAISSSIAEIGKHPITCSILLIGSVFLTPLILYIQKKNNHVSRYELVIKELINEVNNRNRFKR